MKKLTAFFSLGVSLLAIGVALAPGDVLALNGRLTPKVSSGANIFTAGACSSLTARNDGDAFPDSTTVISSAVARPATPAANGSPAHPAHCEVLGTIDARVSRVDGQSYAIKFHMRLPVAAQWNGRFFFEGGGGENGNLSEAFGPVGGQQANDGLSMGFAVISTDSGHDNKTNDNPNAGGTISFAADPQARSDFFYNSYGEVTLLGKALIRLYYDRNANKSYFIGCSEGGREGLLMSQRFFDEYDGILAGDPVAQSVRWSFASIRNAQAVAALAEKAGLKTAKGALAMNKTFSDLDIDLVSKAVLKVCDKLDGLEDGMVSNPAACTTDKIDPGLDELACKGAKTDVCLTRDQIATLKVIESPVMNAKGEEISAGEVFDPGMAGVSEKGINTAWHTTMLGAYDAPENSRRGVSQKLLSVEETLPMMWLTPPQPVAQSEALKYILNYDYSRADPDPGKNYPASGIYTEAPGVFKTTTSTDLTGFKLRGGKMIVYHGVGDPSVPYTETAKWYEAMNARMAASGFVRLFLVPGMDHCRGGPATDKFDMLTPLVKWVEKGKPPASIVSEASAPSYFHVAHRSRPLCPFPQFPHYLGQGDVNEASSFICNQN
jgi:feruloyl esterase